MQVFSIFSVMCSGKMCISQVVNLMEIIIFYIVHVLCSVTHMYVYPYIEEIVKRALSTLNKQKLSKRYVFILRLEYAHTYIYISGVF